MQVRPQLDGPPPRIESGALNHQTGRWGEELVFSYLQWQLAAFTPAGPGLFCDQMFVCPTTGWQVEWINYKEETRKPFDTRIRCVLPARAGSFEGSLTDLCSCQPVAADDANCSLPLSQAT